ncbi:MAG: hypothetical protein Q8R59_06590, partial [Polaromonas sp.]|nr:hypothetical protein [Polaromonas sp.]
MEGESSRPAARARKKPQKTRKESRPLATNRLQSLSAPPTIKDATMGFASQVFPFAARPSGSRCGRTLAGWGAVALLTFGAAAPLAAQTPAASIPAGSAVAAPAPAAPSIEGKTVEGKPFSLPSLKGKVVLVLYWST